MKRITKIFVIMLLLLMMSPLAAIAAPKGYMEVNLTKKNFKKYFEVVKMKHYDEFGDYGGYAFILKSKLLKKGYYLYGANDCAIKGSYKWREKWKYKKKTYKQTDTYKFSMSVIDTINGRGSSNNYKYAKISKFKVKKAKGKLVFIEPSNVIGIGKRYVDGEYYGKIIKLKYPYDKNTRYEYHYDENDNKVIDYYWKYIDGHNTYYNGKNKDGIIVR